MSKKVAVNKEYGGLSLSIKNEHIIYYLNQKYPGKYKFYGTLRSGLHEVIVFNLESQIFTDDENPMYINETYCRDLINALSIEISEKDMKIDTHKVFCDKNESDDRKSQYEEFYENLEAIDFSYDDIERCSKDTNELFKQYGINGGNKIGDIVLVEIPENDYYHIKEYDGMEMLIHGSKEYVLKKLGVKK